MDRFEIARVIQSECKPGMCFVLPLSDYCRIAPIQGFGLAESIMENIAGSAYDWSFHVDPITRDIVFTHHAKPAPDGLRTYVSPDRREKFVQRSDGLFQIAAP